MLKKLYKKYIFMFLTLINIIVLSLLSVFMFLNKDHLMTWISIILGLYLLFNAGSQIIYILSEYRRKAILPNVLALLLFSILGLIVIFNVNSGIIFIALIAGIWTLLNGLVQLINYYFIYRQDKLKYRYFVLADGTTKFFFGISLILHPVLNSMYLSYYLSAVVFLNAVSEMFRFYNYLKNKKQADNLFALPIPIAVAAFLPSRIKGKLKDFSKENDLEILTSSDKQTYPFEILIHIKDGFVGEMGHVDFSLYDKVYSYGCHDPHTRKMFDAIGDGVLIESDRNDFIDYDLSSRGSVLIKFGLDLNSNQLELVSKRLDELLSRSYLFKSDEELGIKNANDYISDYKRFTDATYYKFTNGMFKSYFVLTTNCVQLVDYIITNPELRLFNFRGIISPGTYFDFLLKQYNNKNIVKEMRVLTQKDYKL